MAIENLTTFGVGCIGAVAPEVVRLYNLRLKPAFRWSWSYLLFSVPFILLGGFVAWLLEPTSKYAAFYAGVSTPVLISSITKNAGVTTSEAPAAPASPALPSPRSSVPEETPLEGKGGNWDDVTTRSMSSYRPFPAVVAPSSLPSRNRKPSLFKQFLNAL